MSLAKRYATAPVPSRKRYAWETEETLVEQLKISGQTEFLKLPYHQAILNDRIPLSIGGGIGQSRTVMYLLRTAHLGEVSSTVWPKQLKEICAAKNIHVIE